MLTIGPALCSAQRSWGLRPHATGQFCCPWGHRSSPTVGRPIKGADPGSVRQCGASVGPPGRAWWALVWWNL